MIERLRPDSRARDLANAALLVLFSVVLVALGGINFWGSDWPRWVHLAPVLIAGVATVLRRTNIVASLSLSAAAIALDAALGGSAVIIVMVLDALYNAALSGGRRLRGFMIGLCALATLLIAGALSTHGMSSGQSLINTARGQSFILNLVQVGALLGTPLWWGSNVRQRNEIALLAEQSLELERARAADIERFAVLDRNEAVRSERTRMASDLHDAIASRLSAIAIHSAAALAASESAESSARDRAALELARASSIAALEDMRAMITVLRSEHNGSSADASPSPPIEWLDELTDAARAAGSPVHVRGAVPPGLSPALGQAIYRIVQESLTNASKHAPRSPVELVLDFDAQRGVVLISNHMSAPREAAGLGGALSAGTGLIIMRERAEAFGGTLRAAAVGSQWRVECEVPVTMEIVGAAVVQSEGSTR